MHVPTVTSPLNSNSAGIDVACIRIGNYHTVQGSLLWEIGDVACVRVFSQSYVGQKL